MIFRPRGGNALNYAPKCGCSPRRRLPLGSSALRNPHQREATLSTEFDRAGSVRIIDSKVAHLDSYSACRTSALEGRTIACIRRRAARRISLFSKADPEAHDGCYHRRVFDSKVPGPVPPQWIYDSTPHRSDRRRRFLYGEDFTGRVVGFPMATPSGHAQRRCRADPALGDRFPGIQTAVSVRPPGSSPATWRSGNGDGESSRHRRYKHTVAEIIVPNDRNLDQEFVRGGGRVSAVFAQVDRTAEP